MKKPVMPLIAVAVFGLIGYLFLYTGSLEKETNAIAVEDVSAISEAWNAAELEKRADPGLIKAMGSQGQSPADLLKIYSVLGKLKQPPSCKAGITGSFLKKEERHTTISYECSGDYEKAPAIFAITLSRADGEKAWRIYYLNIKSEIFGEVIE